MVSETKKTYEVVGLSEQGTVITVDAIKGRHDTGDRPSEFGLWGLTPKEQAILRRGMTRNGKDKRPRHGTN